MGSLEQLIDAIAADVPALEPGQAARWWWDETAQEFVVTVIEPEDLYRDAG